MENQLRQRFGSEFFRSIPLTPGVYFMLNGRGAILYIGKAKRLRHRLRSYAQAKPGREPENVLEMIEHVRRIEWVEFRTEREALRRENELLHAIRPPFNIAHTEAENYLFIGIRWGTKKLDWQLSSQAWLQDESYEWFGCFKQRIGVKRGYVALLRLLHAAHATSARFHFPARIARDYPPWLYTADFPEPWLETLKGFLSGRNRRLLHLLVEKLLENENVPAFMRHSLQDDIRTVNEFYRTGPRATHLLKRKYGLSAGLLTHRQMDELIARSLSYFSAQGLALSPGR